MKIFTIQGNHLNSLDDFYNQIESLFITESNFQFGRNLDALHDILYGGFGSFSEDENIQIVWEDFEYSKNNLKEMSIIEEIIQEHKNILLIKA